MLHGQAQSQGAEMNTLLTMVDSCTVNVAKETDAYQYYWGWSKELEH